MPVNIIEKMFRLVMLKKFNKNDNRFTIYEYSLCLLN